MHDWTLVAVHTDWKQGIVRMGFDTPIGNATLQANGFRELHIPRVEAWGPSVSINEVHGPTELDEGLARLSIEMQKGDLIESVARSFEMPAAVWP